MGLKINSSRKPQIEAIEPKTKISQEARRKAKQALEESRERPEIDQTLLQMLSDDYLYPKTRSDGRPAMVPGAMTLETMRRFQEEQTAAIEDIKDARDSQEEAYLEIEREVMKELATDKNGHSSALNAANGVVSEEAKSVPTKRGSKANRTRERNSVVAEKCAPVTPNRTKKQRKRSNKKGSVAAQEAKGSKMQTDAPNGNVKGTKGVKSDSTQSEAPATTTKGRRRRRAKTGLPKSNSSRDRKLDKSLMSTGIMDTKLPNRSTTQSTFLNLQKYYRTELLTAQEEYSLGMKVNFLVKCEQVHEGLALHIGRIPLMQEWAEACG